MKHTIKGIKKDWDRLMWWFCDNSETKVMEGYNCRIFYKEFCNRIREVRIIKYD